MKNRVIWHDGETLTRQMQLAQDFPEKFVQDVLGVLAAEVTLDDKREREQCDTCGTGVNDERYKSRIADKIS